MDSTSTLPDFGHSVYTSCYCEENIYLLIKRFLDPSGGEQQWDAFSVFISNPTRTVTNMNEDSYVRILKFITWQVALCNQRMGSSRDTAVIWDYHVVLALRERSQLPNCYLTSGRGTWIYDLDTYLPIPCHWKGTYTPYGSFLSQVHSGSYLAYVDGTFPLGAGAPLQYQR